MVGIFGRGRATCLTRLQVRAACVAVGILAVAVLAPGPARAEGRGGVFILGGGVSLPSHFDLTLLPYARIGGEYYVNDQFSVALQGTVGSDGRYILGNPMFAFNWLLPNSVRAAAMLGYGNFSKFHGGYRDEGWAHDGFSWGVAVGYRTWVGEGTYLEPELYYSSTSLTSHQTGIGSTGTFIGLGVSLGLDL